MSKKYKLSKSKLLSFRQCPKRLWLQTHRPELAEIDDATSSVMANGTRVGETFRETYPEGVLVDTDDLVSALGMTQALIASNQSSPIFEATFQANDVLVRIDMLAPAEGGYRLVEVKSSTSVKNYHLDDAAIQTWVAQNAGIPILKTEVAHIDNRFVYQGDEQYDGLFAEENVDAEVAERLPQIIHWVREAQALLQGDEPSICAGGQCYEPFACPFVDYCHRDDEQAEFPVEILPRNYGLAANLKADGYADLRDVPEDRLEKAIHQKVLRVTKSGIPELEREAGQLARALPYPRYYLDFETIAFAVPRWANMGINTVLQLREADPHLIRSKFSVVLEKTVRELRGVSCLDLEEVAPDKQQIMCSRSFGQYVYDRDQLEEVVVSYVARAAEKLRKQASVAGALMVFIRTNPFSPKEPQYQRSMTIPLPEATADNRVLIAWALKVLRRIYRAGYAYQKAGVMLSALRPKTMAQASLFVDPENNRGQRLMETLDVINQRWGRGTLRSAAEVLEKPWQMKRQLLSPSYTTDWKGLPMVAAR